MLIGMVSAKGSPGVTVSALALAMSWHRPVLLAECDPAGGAVAAGLLRGEVALAGRGVLRVSTAARRGDDVAAELERNLFALDEAGRLLWLPGLEEPARAALVGEVGERLAAAFTDLDDVAGVDVLVDCGRLSGAASAFPLLRAAALTLLVVRPSVVSVHPAAGWVGQLTRELPASRLGVLVVGAGGYRPAEVAAAVRLPVVATLPDDPGSAAALAAGNGLARPGAPLLAAAAGAAERIGKVATAGTSWPAPQTAGVGARAVTGVRR